MLVVFGKERFVARKLAPASDGATDFDATSGVVENDLMPEKFDGAVELVFAIGKLAIETGDDELIEPVSFEAHKIAT